jgi:hypothetical protein
MVAAGGSMRCNSLHGLEVLRCFKLQLKPFLVARATCPPEARGAY